MICCLQTWGGREALQRCHSVLSPWACEPGTHGTQGRRGSELPQPPQQVTVLVSCCYDKARGPKQVGRIGLIFGLHFRVTSHH